MAHALEKCTGRARTGNSCTIPGLIGSAADKQYNRHLEVRFDTKHEKVRWPPAGNCTASCMSAGLHWYLLQCLPKLSSKP